MYTIYLRVRLTVYYVICIQYNVYCFLVILKAIHLVFNAITLFVLIVYPVLLLPQASLVVYLSLFFCIYVVYIYSWHKNVSSLSLSLSFSVSLNLYLSLSLFLCLSLCLSVSLSLYLCYAYPSTLAFPLF